MEFLHVKPGKGAAFVRTKVKNLLTGGVQERTFRAGENIVPCDVRKHDMQYTYADAEDYVFLNLETFEEVRVSKKSFDRGGFIKEGKIC
jgi:elongation factor P